MREFLAQALEDAVTHGNVALLYGNGRDDPGFLYALRKFVANAKAITDVLETMVDNPT